MATLDPLEIPKLQAYLKKTFGHDGIALKMRDRVNDSAEVIMNGEFIGVIYKDVDEGETSYTFTMSILDIDLPQDT